METKKKTVIVDYSKCQPCKMQICIGVCPEGVIEEGADKKPQITDDASCTSCGVCADLCPTHAITIKPKQEKTE
jgi:NAD-dependent dihydropyrimidine dehydrogenase PreA subunit